MALYFKMCLIPIIASFWQITYSVLICSDVCDCNNNIARCKMCSYNITLKENMNTYLHNSVCCNASINSNWFQKYVNKTFPEVEIHCSNSCNTCTLDLNLVLLDTYSVSIKNNNIAEIRLNIMPLNVRKIDLSSNKLQNINKGLFNHFTNLRKLLLSRNKIVNIFEESFEGLLKLEYLDLSENKLTMLTDIFSPLKNLQHLNISRNNIEFIPENYFNNWLLQHLDVSYNNLKKLAPGALQLLPNLARLLLSDNPHLGITQLDTQLLVGTGRRLQQIDASRIGLYQIPEAFTHSVRFLSLVGNRISAVRCGDLDSYPLLQSLELSDNKIVSLEDDSLGRLEMLLFFNINKNFLTTIPKSLPDELKYLSINNNLIRNLSVPDFKNLPNLRILLLQNNFIRYIEDHIFDDLLSLEMLDLSNNPIQTLSWNTFDGPLSLRDLRLCYLNLSVPEQDGMFPMSSPESVQMLHLQSSPGLAKQFLADSAALAAFSGLQYLDLRMNNLTEIRKDLLFYLGQLKTLRLHGNSINCSTELWLKDWINLNKTLPSGETCYYSTTQAKVEVAKYNCTFPETFTISESLPPVNLYSTEMINKLLRYYGYLNNKTERNLKHGSFSITKNTDNDSKRQLNKNFTEHTGNTAYSNIKLRSREQVILNSPNENVYNVNSSFMVRSGDFSKIDDKNHLGNEQLNKDYRYNTAPNLFVPAPITKNTYENMTDTYKSNKTGKRLNTPIETKSKLLPGRDTTNISDDITTSSTTKPTINVTMYEVITLNPNEKTEYSPYRRTHTNYAQYIGIAAVSSLMIMSLILWISFRLRHRRRRLTVFDTQSENQIEVSNISGGILW